MYEKKVILALSHKIHSNPKQNSTEQITAAVPAALCFSGEDTNNTWFERTGKITGWDA